MEDPEPYLEARGVELTSFFDPTRPAVVDPDHRARVNYELYYFADQKERDRFEADPLAYCGPLTDPVTHRRFTPRRNAPRTDHNGQLFVFESSVSQGVFAAMPDSFALPRFKMPEMDETRDDADEPDGESERGEAH